MNIRQLVSSLNNPQHVLHGAATSGAVAGLSLIDPRKLNKRTSHVYRGTLAALTAWMVNRELEADEELEVLGAKGRAAITAGTAGVAYWLAKAAVPLDSRIHDALIRAGARHPRRWMAAGSGVAAALAWLLSQQLNSDGFEFEEPRPGPTRELHEIPDKLHAILSLLLESTEKFDAPALREQLRQASLLTFNDFEINFESNQLFVPNYFPRVVPGNLRFPVSGLYTTPGGHTFAISLWVNDGHLNDFNIEHDPNRSTAEEYDPFGYPIEPELGYWPDAEDIQLFIETETGEQPLRP